VLVTNHLPNVRGDDDAVWRRIRLVNFDVVVPEAEWDTHLIDKLASDADAILSWAVQGWTEYVAAGHRLLAPDAVKRATDAYRDDSNPVGRFIRERCVIGPAQRVKASELREAFEVWCHEDGSAAVTAKAFGIQIGRLPGVARGNANSLRFYEGIGLAVVLND
jgi:putative DNA primase/helicase